MTLPEVVREIHNDDKLLVDGKNDEVALVELRERKDCFGRSSVVINLERNMEAGL